MHRYQTFILPRSDLSSLPPANSLCPQTLSIGGRGCPFLFCSCFPSDSRSLTSAPSSLSPLPPPLSCLDYLNTSVLPPPPPTTILSLSCNQKVKLPISLMETSKMAFRCQSGACEILPDLPPASPSFLISYYLPQHQRLQSSSAVSPLPYCSLSLLGLCRKCSPSPVQLLHLGWVSVYCPLLLKAYLIILPKSLSWLPLLCIALAPCMPQL